MKEGRRSLRAAVEVAWVRARRTILIADAVMFIAALVLYFLAVGGVAGFAFAMGLTTLIDIVVVFMFTKPFVALLAKTEVLRQGPQALRPRRRAHERASVRRPSTTRAGGLMSGIARRLYRGEVDVDFVGRKKLWYGLSAFLLVISIAGLLFNGLNLGVEFKGGVGLLLQAAGDRQHRAGARAPSATRACTRSIVQTDEQRLAGHHREPPERARYPEIQKAVAEEYGLAAERGQPPGDRRVLGW